MRYLLILAILSTSACAATSCDPCGNWPKPLKASLCDGQEAADNASERIPTATHTGIVNTRFQWIPGPLDIIEHYWEKYHAGAWLKKNAVPMLEKYIPIISKWEQNYEKARNLIIIITPAVLKAMHKL